MEPMIDEATTARPSGAIGQWDLGAIVLAALAVAADDRGTGSLAAAAREVATAAGLGDVLAFPERLPFSPAQLRSMAASPLLQAAALVGGDCEAWAAQRDSA